MGSQVGRRFIGYAELADMLGVPRGTLYAWVSRKQIPHYKVGGSLVRFDIDEVVAWIQARYVAAVPTGDQ